MAKKRISDIAAEHKLDAKALAKQLQEAGFSVPSANATIEEKLAARVIAMGAGPKTNGDAPPPVRPKPQSVGSAARVQPKTPPPPPKPVGPTGRNGQPPPSNVSGRGPRPARPTRDDQRTGERAPAQSGGKRRVVIDSQAARRGPGGPGGPGGGPGHGPPRRPPRSRGRRRRGTYNDTIAPLDVEAQSATDTVRVASGSTVKDVAEYFGIPVPDLIKKLMSLGEMATMTQTLSDDAIHVLAEEFDKDVEIVHAADDVDAEPEYEDSDEDLVTRPPIVTIMGHVDHGKTSLLDAIRETEVAAGEAGGITQHIGAYQVHTGGKAITFLDTPGHEAFTAMRARGAKVTDIAVIVVAADDGVKPQTEEAIDHARAAGVPIVVAVNKIDKEGADPTRVRTEMTTRDLQPAEWGGETEYVDVSAKTRDGLDTLLETLQVVADLQELKSNPDAEASGTVVESKLDPGRGPVVTVLITRGTLAVGDALVAGPHWGKVRAMHDYKGLKMKTAVPGDPVEVLGFDGVPDAGEFVHVVENDKRARVLASERANRLKTEALARRSGRKVSLEDVFKRASSGGVQELSLVVKSDVAGSLEALEDEIAKLPQDEISATVIHRGVGGINESDIMLAAASDAIVLGFNVRPVGDAAQLADREGVEIRLYSIIYRAIEEIRAAMQGMLAPEEVEETVGKVEIRETFRASKIGIIAGSYVTEGTVKRGASCRLVRDGTVVWTGEIESLRRFSDDVREVSSGFECGIVLRNFQDVKEGDALEVYETRQVERELK